MSLFGQKDRKTWLSAKGPPPGRRHTPGGGAEAAGGGVKGADEMIVLIGGVGHTGKTLLSQRLLEQYRIPSTSLDHLKMGLAGGFPGCGFGPEDSWKWIGERMAGMVENMLRVCRENGQSILLEGCYLMPEQAKKEMEKGAAAVFLAFGDGYIDRNFQRILDFENVIERRRFPGDLSLQKLKEENCQIKEACRRAGVPLVEVSEDYRAAEELAAGLIFDQLFSLRPYEEGDLEKILGLFYDTVHQVCRRDYTKEQLRAWADGKPDMEAWESSLKAHETVTAWLGEGLAGFGDLDGDYLDRLYVHKNYQGLGIGSRIAKELEGRAARANCKRVTTHASLTARPFFEARGYRVKREQQVERRGVRLTNFVMEKELAQP